MENKKLKYIITLQTNKIVKETEKSALYQLSENKQIWIPFSSIKSNKLMYWTARMLAYENDSFSYSVIEKDKKIKVTLIKLAENILKNPENYNVKIEEYVKKESTKPSTDDELIEW